MFNQRGASLIFVITSIAGVALLIQFFMVARMQSQVSEMRRTQVREMKIHLLNSLLEVVRDEMTLRNSRIDVNSIIFNCLGATGECDEREMYDFVIFNPTPPFVFTGEWPPAPVGLNMLAGGLTANKVFYNIGGGRCLESVVDLTTTCPLQAIGRLRPLCGGTPDAPAFSVPGGADCAGPATGFDIFVGVASFWEGRTDFNPDTTTGDQRSFRIGVRTFFN